MLKVVLDSNIYVSAILRPDGLQASLIRMVMYSKFQLLISINIIEEVKDVLSRPRIKKYLKANANEIERFFRNILTYATFIDFEEVISAVERDPDDNVIITTAVLGKADYIVSGDIDLLDLNPFQGIAILKPRDFLAVNFHT